MLLTISTDATASKASDCDCLVGVVFVTDDDDDDNDDGVTGEVFLLMLGLIIIVCISSALDMYLMIEFHGMVVWIHFHRT